MTKRLLITGSRNWNDFDKMQVALKAAYMHLRGPGWEIAQDVILVSGNAKGADKIAEGIWRQNVGEEFIERHPAKDFPHPLKRNEHMVRLGADICLAFPTVCQKVFCDRPLGHFSHGTDFTIEFAKRAGIDTRVVLG